MMNQEAINQARAIYYTFYARFFNFVEKADEYHDIGELLDILIANPLDEQSLVSFSTIQKTFHAKGYHALKEEYDDVFTAATSGYVPISASYYDEGRDDGQKRVKAAGLVFRSKFRKNDLVCKDAEDQITFIFQFMSHLIRAGVQGDAESLALAKEFFSDVINDFIDEFLDILIQQYETNVLYKNAAVSLVSFMAFERLYLNVEASHKKASQERVGFARQTEKKPITPRGKRNLDEIVL